MRKIIKKIFLVLLVCFLAAPTVVGAQLLDPGAAGNVEQETQNFGRKAGFSPEASLSSVIPAIIGVFLGLLGIIFVILIIYAGYNWMTAAGDSDKVDKAKETLQRAIIGLVITVSAYAITYFVFTNIERI
jgi:hypothetical protein